MLLKWSSPENIPALGLMAALVAAGCSSDATGLPATQLTVVVRAVHGPEFLGAPPGLTVQCMVDLRATFQAGEGGVGEEAVWLHANRLIYIDGIRVDSTTIQAPTVRTAWGAPTISMFGPQFSTWTVSAAAPFTAAFVYVFELAGRGTRVTRVEFVCGTPWPSGGPPVVTALSVTPASGDMESGDTLRVAYTATSTLDIWSSRVVLSGACDVQTEFREPPTSPLSRTAIVVLPPACRPGETVTVDVEVMNLAGVTGTRRASTGPVIVDVTPPVATVTFFSHHDGSPTSTPSTTTYFTDDSIFVSIRGQDNQAVTRLLWEVRPSGVRDSIVVPIATSNYSDLVVLRIQRDWIGRQKLLFYVRDGAGHTSDTLFVPSDSLRIYPDTAYPEVTTSLSGVVSAVAIDNARDALYALQAGQGRILVLSLATLAVTDTIPIGGFATDLDLSAGGDSLVIALTYTRALGIVDLRAADPIMTQLPMPALDDGLGQRPARLRVAANGKAILVVTGSPLAAYTLWEVDLGTGMSRLRTDAGEGGVVGVGVVARSPSHGTIVLQGDADRFQRYDAAGDAFSARATATPFRLLPSLDSAASRVALRTNLYDGTLAFVRQVEVPDGFTAGPSVLSVDGAVLYYGVGTRHIIHANGATGGLLTRAPLAVAPTELYVSGDGRRLVAVGSTATTSAIAVLSLPGP